MISKRIGTVNVNSNLTSSQMKLAKPSLELALALAPGWLNSVDIEFQRSSDREDNIVPAAQVLPMYQYRKATIQLFPDFFASSDDEREEYLTHEMVHCLQAPILSVLESMGEALGPSDATAWIRREVSNAVEASCQDVTLALLSLMR
jgi:hypothetical protein